MGGEISEIAELRDLDTTWPPMRQIERGWRRLEPDGRARVVRRIALALERFDPPETADRAAMRRFFSFLAQMEPIAIDVPLAGLEQAEDPELVPLLERQLADEVFHALLFAKLATVLGGIEPPIRQAERVLDRIRAPEDPRLRHVLLNIIAEGWFETLFEHASTWGVADEIFRMALADEARHVEEGQLHARDITPEEAEPAVRAFEQELFAMIQNPRVMLPHLALAGQHRLQDLSEAYLETHRLALAEIGLEPAEAVTEMMRTLKEGRLGQARPQGHLPTLPEPIRIEPETQWRETALHLWDAPRNPVMHGWFDVPTDHIPEAHLTAIFTAAVGQVWHAYPRINRYTRGGEIYQPPGVNVGVRVALGESMEALSTIVIHDAHQRSVRDIERLLQAGVREMNALGEQLDGAEPGNGTEALREILRDDELMAMLPPGTVAAPVTLSNVGQAGLVAGVGAMPGALGQSVELIMGRVEERPRWDGERYVPGRATTIGASADHRVIDGGHAAVAMARIEEALSEEGVQAILAREDTLGEDEDLAEVALAEAGVSHQQVQVLMSCKLPFWLGWLCWLFKK